MKALKFVVRYPDGRAEEFFVDSDRVLIGSGAHCDIRLPVDQAAVEHVAVTMGGATAYAEARAFQPPPTLNGSPFAQAPLLSDAILGIGSIQIVVTVEELAADAGVVHKKEQKTSPLTYLLAAVAVPLSVYVLWGDDNSADTSPPPAEAPALWDEAPQSCPQSSAEQARVVASDKLALAESRRERRPFHVQDGVAAVPLFEQAAACYKLAGDVDSANEALAAAKELRAQVGEDYRTHRVRLEHAISVGDWSTAQTEARILLAFTEGKQTPYVTWLSNLERRLQLKYGRKGP